ncbi:WYL domain-containing protein [Paenibacillus eucommiae]|uniref:WYL domain-containing protein n=1 Tax=Paenibacillus eucommiae TaxID=1355755 RepID=A0ABS4J9R8_9BACL|nr:WYL domain-containing protein [Paenibacillus eucommiae]MBP1996591.1 hypothetical protein [Paenibacillus eucommiae]
MNPFEKIFNYQLLSRLDESGTFMITSHERSWLKMMLQHPAAAEAFTAVTLDKLQLILELEQPLELTTVFVEKARSLERQVYHPHLRLLRRCLVNKSRIRLSFSIKGDQSRNEQLGFPYKLEYSMVKREWYLLWYHLRNHMLMSTRLQKISTITEESLPEEMSAKALADIQKILEKRKAEAFIQINKEYNRELSRILYAFSCFEKEVSYDASDDRYTIHLSFAGNESEYVLSKIRFLGKRVRIIGNEKLQQRMLETASKALERYGISDSSNETDT